MKGKKKIVLIGTAVLLLIGTVVSWASTSTGQSVSISSGSTASGGGVADTTRLLSSFTMTQGQAQKISGLELFRVDLGSAVYRNDIRIFFSLLNPEDIGKVLNNPRAFIEIQVGYKVNSGEDYTLGDGTKVKKTLASGIISVERGEIVLFPAMGEDTIDSDTYWVLGAITAPGGVPPGQQAQLNELRFYLDVRL